MKEMYDRFEQYLVTEKMVSVNTVSAYHKDIMQCIGYLEKQGVSTFQEVTSDHIKSFLRYIRITLKISARTASRKLSSLKSFCKYLQMYHHMHDFTHGVSFPKLEKKLPKFLTEDDIMNLFAIAKADTTPTGYRNSVMLSLLYACGVRVSELISLKSSDIDFSQGLLYVSGKGGKERIVPLPENMIQYVKLYLHKIQPLLLESVSGASDYLFPTIYAGHIKHITRQAFWDILKKLVKKAGLADDISPHVLRHSVATHLLRKGANLRLLQLLLGHEQLQTVQIYTHMDVSHLRKLYDEKHPRA